MKEESESDRLQRLSDEEFARTGVFNANFKMDITITENDMIKDLVNKTAGKNIKIDKPNNN